MIRLSPILKYQFAMDIHVISTLFGAAKTAALHIEKITAANRESFRGMAAPPSVVAGGTTTQTIDNRAVFRVIPSRRGRVPPPECRKTIVLLDCTPQSWEKTQFNLE